MLANGLHKVVDHIGIFPASTYDYLAHRCDRHLGVKFVAEYLDLVAHASAVGDEMLCK